MDRLHFKHGEIIFREGEDSDFAYIVESGTVEIFKQLKRGTVLLATLNAGEIFGEMGLLSDLPRSASAAADGMVTVKRISREYFNQMLSNQPQELVITMKAWVERLREMNAKISKLVDKQAQFQLVSNTPPAVKRVVLLPLSDSLKQQIGKGIVISLPYRVGALPPGEKESTLDWNNLLIENADTTIMSRNHFAIHNGYDGLTVVDRGSRSGTIVNGQKIGGDSMNYEAKLSPGENTVIAGDELSPYRFAIVWEAQ